MKPSGRIGRYVLRRPLGRGAMGEVWEAELQGPRGFRKPVALKLLRQEVVEQEHLESLVQEARLGALLAHPNVVGTLELGSEGPQWYVAMELVRGASVSSLHKALRLPPQVVVEIGIQTCAGLAHIHGLEVDGRPAGLVHRDVKGANLLVDRSGLLKIADLGIARLQGMGGQAAGTPGYMAPEQAKGREEARSDLFSLGVLLCYLATTKRPFPTPKRGYLRVEDVENGLRDDTVIAAVDRSIPGLGPVASRCLDPDPAGRWASAWELSDALRGVRARLGPGPSLLDVLHQVSGEVRRDDTSPGSRTGSSSMGMPTVVLPSGDLPRRADRFVGRGTELARAEGLVQGDGRLVTLLGPGGMGKTRLALEVAGRARPAGGAWFCDLSSAVSFEGILHAVGRGLSVAVERNEPVEQLGRAFAALGRVLVILDNLEQVTAEVAPMVTTWLKLAPDATFLATTRVALGVRGERVVQLGPLSETDAVELFVERAASDLEDSNDLRALVNALDRLPLAIELAAARTRVLSVSAIHERLQDRFRLLRGSSRELPERHRSLRASLDGSWELLDEGERGCLAQLSAFAGGFTIEAAEAVVDLEHLTDPPWTLDLLDSLVTQSLVTVSGRRFALLESVRAYAHEKLDPELRARVHARHGRFFAQYGVAEALAAVHRTGGARRGKELADEVENLVVACRRAADRDDGAIAGPTALAAYEVFNRTGPLKAAVEVLERAHAVAPDDLLVARMYGWILFRTGSVEAARVQFERVAGDLSNPVQQALARVHLGTLERRRGDPAAAELHYQAARPVLQAQGRPRDRGVFFDTLGNLCLERGRPTDALPLYTDAEAAHGEDGDQMGIAHTRGNRSLALHMLGRWEEARAVMQGALHVAREMEDVSAEAVVLGQLAALYKDMGDARRCRRAGMGSLELHQRVGDRRHEATTRTNVALAEMMEGRFDVARSQLTKALELFDAIGGDRRLVGFTWTMRARVERVAGDLQAAAEHLAVAADVSAKSGDQWLASSLRSEQGALALALDRLDDALTASRDGLEGLLEVGDAREATVVAVRLVTILLRVGDGVSAREALVRAEELAGALEMLPAELEQALVTARASVSAR